MSAWDVLTDLLQCNVMLWTEGAELCFQAPKGVMTPLLRQAMVENKGELIASLGERQKWLACSFSQQRLWFLYQLQPQSAAYNIVEAVMLSGPLDAILLERCLNLVVARHETLRTVFSALNGLAIQHILPSFSLSLHIVDLRTYPEEGREAEAHRLVTEEVCLPFDLAHGPLIRVSLFKLSDQKHVLAVVAHHIISDGWSMNVLIRELAALYKAFGAGGQSPLPPLAIQYSDYTLWHREWLQEEVLDKHIAYWRRQLDGIPPALDLPTDHSRPPVQTFRGAHQPFVIPASLSDALGALSRREGVTLFMTLLAAFDVLLYRYTGEEDVVVGSPVANRDRVEIEPLIGVFVNTLVLRSKLAGNPTFVELLHRVQDVALNAYSHQALPFEKLVDELVPKRDLSRNPLFQVMFILQNARRGTSDGGGLTIAPLQIETGTSQVDLSFSLLETDQGIAGQVEYSTDLFSTSTVSRMISHFLTLLGRIVADPVCRLANLSILTDDERKQVLVDWNATQIHYPHAGFIHELFEAQVERMPNAVALVSEGGNISYYELNRRANQLAHYLQSLGVGPEVLVAICIERSVDMVVAIYAAIKAGGGYVPLEPEYPRNRMEVILQDANVPIVLTTKALASRLPSCDVRIVCVDADWGTIARQSTQNPASYVVEDNLAYVIYTSGSTGKPKGAMNTHAGIRNRLLWMQDACHLTSADCVMLKTPFSFDVSVWELFLPLIVGARLVVGRPEGHKDTAYLAQAAALHGVTTLHFVPSMLQLFLREPKISDLHSLRCVICSGEVLSHDLQELFFSRLNAQLYNLYGPAEAAVDVTCWQCQRNERSSIVPIGRPIANTQIYLLDRDFQPVPPGVPGELYIAGEGLSRGYVGSPGLTASKFVPNAFDSVPGRRMYRTGDVACYLSDGNIEFLRRTDDQVKIRGLRVEPREIELLLSTHLSIQQAVVMAQKDHLGDNQLVAYIMPQPEQQPTVGEIRHFLMDRLPENMVPSRFITVSTWPLLPNGKVDRGGLLALTPTRIEREMVFTPPRNELEQRIAAVWSRVLDVGSIGIDDDFFDLGGHSFKAIRVVGELGDIGVMDLFKYPTIRQLAEFMSSNEGEDEDGILHRLTRSTDRAALSLVCVPYGGGSAIAYYPLSEVLPEDYALYAVSIPGHEFDQSDHELLTLEEVAQTCVEEINRKTMGPIVLYGHCLGVALTIEIARLLEKDDRRVTAVFLGASYPFHIRSSILLALLKRLIHLVPTRRLQSFLRSLGGFEEVIDLSEMAFVARNFRHDFQLALMYFTQAHKSRNLQKLKSPIIFIAGNADPLTKRYQERFHNWEFFSESVTLRTVNGGHYFVKHQARDVAQIIADYLQHSLRQAPEYETLRG